MLKSLISHVVCYRCRKPIELYTMGVTVTYPFNRRGIARAPQIYHQKCLPPLLLRSLLGSAQPAGSRPAR